MDTVQRNVDELIRFGRRCGVTGGRHAEEVEGALALNAETCVSAESSIVMRYKRTHGHEVRCLIPGLRDV